MKKWSEKNFVIKLTKKVFYLGLILFSQNVLNNPEARRISECDYGSSND